MRRLLTLAVAAILAAACAAPTTTTTTTTATAAPRPRLVVFMAVDGLPQRQVVDYRDQLGPDGFARFLDRGAWFADAHYAHAFTVTAAGHAVMLTGAYPHRTGIIGNDWRDNKTGELEYCTGDTAHKYIGHETKKLDGTSPKNLQVETVGDVLRGANPASKVIAISGKDRGAILPGGHKGTAYMYQTSTGRFASSTYYMKEHPGWVDQFHAGKPADKFLGAEWKPLLADSAYAKSLPDGQKWYMKGGALPKKMGDTKLDGPYYSGLLPSPFSDRLTLDFARAAIVGEGLGQDDVPDILSVSLSGHDYVNHAYSAESRLSHDHVLQLDRTLQEFFRYLDEKIGRDSYIVVLTADHGFMPAPEHSQSQGHASGRLSGSQTVARINKALEGRFGQGPFIRYASARALVIDRNITAARGVSFDAVAEETRKLLVAEPAIAAAYTRAELESKSRSGAPYFDQMVRTWHKERSGDVEYALKPYWMMTSSTSTTTHGSPHPYDTNVPILFYGPAWVKPGKRDARVEVADIAPTLAQVLGIPAPSGAEGKPLPLR